MTRQYRLVLVIALAAAGLSACNTNRGAVMAAQVPDEFLTVSRSPLVVPPDYALRPPLPGEPRPSELSPETTARAALVGQSRLVANSGTEGERLLMTKARADVADPKIREVIDDEQGDITHKPQAFANSVMFWRKDDPTTHAIPQTATPLDAEAEARRLQQLTAGQAVTIARSNTQAPAQRRGFKLPGL